MILTSIFVLLTVIFSKYNFTGCVLITAAYLSLWALGGDLISSVSVHWQNILICTIVYIIIGVVWSVIDTKRRLYNVKKNYERLKILWKEQELPAYKRHISGMTEKDKEINIERRRLEFITGRQIIPTFSNVMTSAAQAIAMWPFCIFWAIFDDLIVYICEKIAHVYKTLYMSIYDNTIGYILKELGLESYKKH
jgi:hypothetical protein